jgi:hypothetical protein
MLKIREMKQIEREEAAKNGIIIPVPERFQIKISDFDD